MVAYAGSSLAGVIAGAFFVRELLWNVRKNFQRHLVVPILRSSLPILFASFGGMFMYNVDVIMLGWWRTAEEIGWYAAAQKIVGITSVVPGLIATAVFPVVSRLVHAHDTERLRDITQSIMKMNYLIVMPVVAGGMVVGGALLQFLFGVDYANAVPPFSIYVFSLLATCQIPFFVVVIYAFDKQVSTIWYGMVVSVINLVVSFLLIRPYGMVGAAIASTITPFVFTAFLWARVSSLMKFDFPYESIKFMFAAVCMSLFAFVLHYIGLHILLTIGLAAVFYVVLLELLGKNLRAEIRSLISS